jgi:hypothetical protein
MLITAELLLDSIFLLLNDNSTRNQKAVLELITLYDADTKMMDASDGDLIRFYVRVLHKIIDDNIDKTDEQTVRTFMLKFKSDPAYDRNREVMDLLQDAVTSRQTMDADQLKKLFDRVQTVLLWHHTNAIVRRNFGRLNRATDLVTSEAQQAELMSILRSAEDMQTLLNKSVETGSIAQGIDTINFMDRKSIRAGLEKHKARNIAGRIRTGLQGLNLMLGKAGGAVAGESITFNALPHMYKSGILMSWGIWSVIHNVPVAPDGLKPMVYIASLENEAFQNMFWAFRQQYHIETGLSPDGLSDDKIEEWLYEHFSKHGCTLMIERHLPHSYGFNEFMTRVSYWRSQGFFIVVAIVDYANLMNKSSDDKSASKGGRDLGVRELFSKMCNFSKNLGMIFVTAHPINREGMRSISNQTNMVKRLGPEHLADSVDVEREVDVSIYMHLETNSQGTRFLTMRINKHRYVDDTPEAHKYCAYPFDRPGVGILDDLGGPPRFTRDIYAYEFEEGNNTLATPESVY